MIKYERVYYFYFLNNVTRKCIILFQYKNDKTVMLFIDTNIGRWTTM